MRIEVYDSPRRFLVESETIPGAVHLVDFEDKRPFCDCEDFLCRKNPRIRDQGVNPQLTTCKHIREVAFQVGWALLTTKELD